MSLDIWLTSPETISCPECGSKINIPAMDDDLYQGNITHNLGKMASESGIYKHLWRPDELGINTAKELIEPLSRGLEKLKMEPEYYDKFNPENGWGSYDGLVAFVERYLAACKQYPEATIHISR